MGVGPLVQAPQGEQGRFELADDHSVPLSDYPQDRLDPGVLLLGERAIHGFKSALDDQTPGKSYFGSLTLFRILFCRPSRTLISQGSKRWSLVFLSPFGRRLKMCAPWLPNVTSASCTSNPVA